MPANANTVIPASAGIQRLQAPETTELPNDPGRTTQAARVKPSNCPTAEQVQWLEPPNHAIHRNQPSRRISGLPNKPAVPNNPSFRAQRGICFCFVRKAGRPALPLQSDPRFAWTTRSELLGVPTISACGASSPQPRSAPRPVPAARALNRTRASGAQVVRSYLTSGGGELVLCGCGFGQSSGTSSSATMLMIFMRGLIAGPAVSL